MQVTASLGCGVLLTALLGACTSPAGERDARATAEQAVPAALVEPAAVPLTRDTLSAWRAYVLPDADDLAYASIPWHVTFAGGMEAARAEGKPLLMWAMNGHPLGCT